jgi:glyoxylase-like metal-dependent hydrolase (beta-lactamase superfamily II)
MSSESSKNDREALSPRDGRTWAEFGVYEVVEGVYRVPLSLPLDSLRAVNVYVIVGESSVSLIDSGAATAQSWKQLGHALSTIGVELGDIDRVLATHIHYDHYGQATRLRHSAGAFVFLGAGERASLERIVYNRESLRPGMEKNLREHGAADLLGVMKQLTIGAASEGFEVPDEYLGERVVNLGGRSVEAIHTPGHTSGHMNFYDRANGLLFTGDHVLPHITPSIGHELEGSDLPLQDFLDSLARVRNLPTEKVLPAHGPVFEDLPGRVDELLRHHEHRLAAALEIVGVGEMTSYDVSKELPWTRREVRFSTLDTLNRYLAVGETAAHLDLLVSRGDLSRRCVDGVNVYGSPASVHGSDGR